MERVLTELTPECELTTQMYISGMEKEEIAEAKCRAFSTINNQLQKAFKVLNVKNGRELCREFYERVSGVEFTFDFPPALRVAVTCFLLCLFFVDMHLEQQDVRRTRRTRSQRTERIERMRRLE